MSEETQPTAGRLLAGRCAVVTGGSRGIGRAIAMAMAQQGADVAIVYHGRTEAAEAVRTQAAGCGVTAAAYCCDVADFAAAKAVCAAIVADFGQVDIVVNNAGVIRDNLLLRMSEADFDLVLSVNLKGTFNITRHLVRSLLASPYGRLINIASVTGLVGNPGQANYSAAKAGLIGFTKTMARELAGRGVTCNAIAPGLIGTDMTAGLTSGVRDSYAGRIPLGRAGTPQEVANLAVFLASDLAAYITGEVVRVDGGLGI